MAAYTYKEMSDALNDMWEILLKKLNPQEIEELKDKHPVINELDESGPQGYCGIGLGKYGGHAIGD
jgi:glutamine synthetase adenylyltransferase